MINPDIRSQQRLSNYGKALEQVEISHQRALSELRVYPMNKALLTEVNPLDAAFA